MALWVQKYGGTSVADPERIRAVARRCLQARAAGHDLVVVVSAMSGETNRLLKLVQSMNQRPSEREQDVVVATGEQVTIGLLSLAIQAAGGQATSFLAHQCRIVTDSTFSKARIKRIDEEPLRAALSRGEVAVVAGFQGIDEDGNVTTLGRGGSDTTAVALAAALRAERCEIYTDVDGVYTADPNVCPAARKLDRISYEEMLEEASLGAKVLQIRSVEFAMKYRVPLWVKSSFSDDPGTLVCEEDAAMEDVLVSGITYDRNEARLELRGVPDRPGVAARIFGALNERNIVVDIIVQTAQQDGRADLSFTVGRADLPAAREVMDRLVSELGLRGVESDDQVAKISIVGVGMRNHSGVAAKMFEVLGKEGINIQSISTSEIKVSCVVAAKYTELAVRALHSAFGLDRPEAAEAR
ncbi:MAG TPA: aspartate kinase [Myxococcaceae bacterium]|nr:aspartate kinase [Myxococcaceae bacterium]